MSKSTKHVPFMKKVKDFLEGTAGFSVVIAALTGRRTASH